MLKAIAIIAGVIVVAAGGVLGYAATRPDEFHVQRSASIKATPERIAAFIGDFQRWPAWSPYENKDPAMKRKVSSPASGKGAIYEWEGNSDVGKGRMEITEASPTKVAIKLDFEKPFETHNQVEFTIAPSGDATNVTWSMRGRCPYIAKVIGIFFSMDDMIGKDFEAGLASLKTAAEK